MAGNSRKGEWTIQGEKNGKRLKLVLIEKAVPASGEVDEVTVGTVATTGSHKGHCRAPTVIRRLNTDQSAAALLQRRAMLGTMLRMDVPHPTCVFQKRLTKSDIDGGQSRLQLCREEVRKSALYQLLTPEKKAAVEGGIGVKVRVVDPVGREHPMTFQFYPKSVKQYRFIGRDYGKLVRENGWMAGQTLELWGNRLGGDGVNADGQGELVLGMLNYGGEEEEKTDCLGSDQESHCSGLTPEEREVVGILAQMRRAALTGDLDYFRQ